MTQTSISILLPNTHSRIRTLTRAFSLLLAALGFINTSPAADAPAPSVASTPFPATNRPTVLIVVGAPGEPEYAGQFADWARLWQDASQRGEAQTLTLGAETETKAEVDAPTNDWSRLQALLTAQPKSGPEPLWLVLIGHGTFDGTTAKFNLRGPDLAAADLAAWLQPFTRPLAVINTAASSSPFINRLSASNRVIVTATRSGYEQNYARFGQYLAAALANPASDLDHDGQTSLLEAFLTASRQTDAFFQLEGRLATEHALIDDNADALGTPADWFRGVRAVKQARDGAALDGPRAHQFHLVPSPAEHQLTPAQRAQRNQLEQSLAELRQAKSAMADETYYRQLESILLDLARIYESSP